MTGRILVVEDELALRDVVSYALRGEGFAETTADDNLKTMRLLHRIENELLQFPAIGARTRKPHVLPPIFRCCRRTTADFEQELHAVFPELRRGGVPRVN